MPSKLTGMMASGRAIIATAMPGTQITETLEGAGLVVAPGDAAKLAAGIASLAGDVGLRERLGRAARERAVGLMGKESILEKFESDLVAMCARR
jgi:colanic acid biosynthesis glycosyl transferase WcaI